MSLITVFVHNRIFYANSNSIFVSLYEKNFHPRPHPRALLDFSHKVRWDHREKGLEEETGFSF